MISMNKFVGSIFKVLVLKRRYEIGKLPDFRGIFLGKLAFYSSLCQYIFKYNFNSFPF